MSAAERACKAGSYVSELEVDVNTHIQVHSSHTCTSTSTWLEKGKLQFYVMTLILKPAVTKVSGLDIY